MTTTVVANTTDVYVKRIDSAVTAFTLQNVGHRDIYAIITTGAAPEATDLGLTIKPNHGLSRTHGEGDVYIKSIGGNPSPVAVVQ